MDKRQQDINDSKKKELQEKINILKKLLEANPGLLGIEETIKELDKKMKSL